MRIFNWRRLRKISLRKYEVDSSLDRDLDLLLKVKKDENEGDEYLVPKPKKSIKSIRISKNNSEYGFFLQEYPHDVDYLDEDVLVPGTIVDELTDPFALRKEEPVIDLKPVRVSRDCLGYSYYLKEYPHDIERIDDSIIVPSAILKR